MTEILLRRAPARADGGLPALPLPGLPLTALPLDGLPLDGLPVPAPRTPNPGPGGAVVIHPGSRRWPVERFAALARRLHPAGSVVLTGHAADRPVALAVAAAAGLRPDQVLAGRTTPDELAALVSCAALVVTGAVVVADLAAAHGRPSVVLGGPLGSRPPGPHRALTRRGDQDGLGIGVEEVLEACVAVL